MTREDLKRWEEELQPLVPAESADAFTRGDAAAYNASVEEVRAALLDPALHLLEKGSSTDKLAPCLERTVAELAFWRRVLVETHRDGLRAAPRSPEFLVQYLLS